MEGGTEAESSTLAAQLLQRITRATLTGLVLVRICTSSGEFWTRGYPLEEIFPRLLGIPDQGCGVKADPASDAPLGNTTIRLVFAQASASSGPERAGLDSDSNDESGRPSTYTHTVKHTHTHTPVKTGVGTAMNWQRKVFPALQTGAKNMSVNIIP